MIVTSIAVSGELHRELKALASLEQRELRVVVERVIRAGIDAERGGGTAKRSTWQRKSAPVPGEVIEAEDGLTHEILEDAAEPVYVAAPRVVEPEGGHINLEGLLGTNQAVQTGIPTGQFGYGGRELKRKPKLNVPITAPKKWE